MGEDVDGNDDKEKTQSSKFEGSEDKIILEVEKTKDLDIPEGDQLAKVLKEKEVAKEENKEKSKSPNDKENEEEISPEVKKSKDEDKPLGDHSAEVIDQMAMDDLESNEVVEKSQS